MHPTVHAPRAAAARIPEAVPSSRYRLRRLRARHNLRVPPQHSAIPLNQQDTVHAPPVPLATHPRKGWLALVVTHPAWSRKSLPCAANSADTCSISLTLSTASELRSFSRIMGLNEPQGRHANC